MAFVKDGQTILVKETIWKFATANRLNHTNRDIVFVGVHLDGVGLQNTDPRSLREILNLRFPLVHEELLVHNDEEATTKAHRNVERHVGLSISTGDTNQSISSLIQEGLNDLFLEVVRGKGGTKGDCGRESESLRNNVRFRFAKFLFSPVSWNIEACLGFIVNGEVRFLISVGCLWGYRQRGAKFIGLKGRQP